MRRNVNFSAVERNRVSRFKGKFNNISAAGGKEAGQIGVGGKPYIAGVEMTYFQERQWHGLQVSIVVGEKAWQQVSRQLFQESRNGGARRNF